MAKPRNSQILGINPIPGRCFPGIIKDRECRGSSPLPILGLIPKAASGIGDKIPSQSIPGKRESPRNLGINPDFSSWESSRDTALLPHSGYFGPFFGNFGHSKGHRHKRGRMGGNGEKSGNCALVFPHPNPVPGSPGGSLGWILGRSGAPGIPDLGISGLESILKVPFRPSPWILGIKVPFQPSP